MNFRVSLACSFLFIGCWAANAAQISEFSYSTSGAQLGQIVKDLSKISGEKLKVSDALEEDVFAMSVQGGSFADLKARLAAVEHAEWAQEPGYQLLKQTSALNQREENQSRVELTKGFDKALRDQSEALHAHPQFDSQSATVFARRVEGALAQFNDPRSYTLALQSLKPSSPSYRGVVRLLGEFKPSDFVDLPLRQKVTYSNEPTRSQRPLPPEAEDAVAQFLEEQKLWAQAASQIKFPPLVRGSSTYALPEFIANNAVPSGAPSKILLSFYRESSLGRVLVELKIATPTGAIINRATASLRPTFEPALAGGEQLDSLTQPVSPAPEALSLGGMASGPVSNPQTKDALLHPDTVDPLSLAYGSTLIQVANSEHLNLIAELSDSCFDGGLRQLSFPSSKAYLVGLAKRDQSCEAQDNWLTVAPRDRFLDRLDRAHRSALGFYLRSSMTDSFSIESQAACALSLPDPLENMMPATILARLQNRTVGLGDVALLRFYGSLSQEERTQAASQSGLRLAEIQSPYALTSLNEIVYARNNPLIIPRHSHSELWRDPTECLANGLSSASNLYLSAQTVDAVFDTNRDKLPFQMNAGWVSAGEVAFGEYRNLHPELYSKSGSSKEAHYRVGELVQYSFDFKFGPDISTVGTLIARDLAQGEPLTLSELPQRFQDEVAKSLAEVETVEASVGPNQRPRTTNGAAP
jgi:hypothetical protein